MAYRDETDPLKIQESTLGAELARLRQRERAVTKALAETRTALRRTLTVVDRPGRASPCSASWEDMPGDARVRLCQGCAKNVYDLSALAREEAGALLASSEEKTSVRLYHRKDGTVLTSDCPVGAKAKRVRGLALLAAVAAGAACIGLGASIGAAVPRLAMCEGPFLPSEGQTLVIIGRRAISEADAPPPVKHEAGTAERRLTGDHLLRSRPLTERAAARR